MVHLSETVCGIFHFRFRLVFIKLKPFLFNKMYGLMPNLTYTALQIAFSENIIGQIFVKCCSLLLVYVRVLIFS